MSGAEPASERLVALNQPATLTPASHSPRLQAGQRVLFHAFDSLITLLIDAVPQGRNVSGRLPSCLRPQRVYNLRRCSTACWLPID